MKQFRDPYFQFPEGRMGEFFMDLDASLPKGWWRERDAEERAKQTGIKDRELYYYACDKKASREAAMIAIYPQDAHLCHVVNVVPQSEGQLSEEQYNVILRDFYEQVLSKTKTNVPVSFLLGSDDLQLENLMPPDAFRHLKAFSSGANRSTGTAHPSDQERWFGFIVALHRSGKAEGLDATTLQRWFEEAENWHPDHATKLAIEYENAIALLSYAAQH